MSYHTVEQRHLLNLPREIRDKIYDHLFQSAPLTFEIHPESSMGFDKKPPFWVLLPRSTFSIMLTCRVLHHETQERRFTVHWWHFKNLGGLEYFNRYASKARKASVRRVTGVQLANYRYKKQLCQLPNLRYVQVGPLRTHFGMMPLTNPTKSARPFDDIEWDDLIFAVNQAGFDWFAPYGVESLVTEGKWDEFVLDVDFDVNEIGHSRYWVPTTLNAKTNEIVRLWDQVRDSKGGVSWSQLRPVSPSPCVLSQFDIAKADPLVCRDRWKRFMTVG